MTQEQFEEFINETIPQHLFHVGVNDLDIRGGKRDEVILVNLIASDLGCLKYKPLQWFIDTFLHGVTE